MIKKILILSDIFSAVNMMNLSHYCSSVIVGHLFVLYLNERSEMYTCQGKMIYNHSPEFDKIIWIIYL